MNLGNGSKSMEMVIGELFLFYIPLSHAIDPVNQVTTPRKLFPLVLLMRAVGGDRLHVNEYAMPLFAWKLPVLNDAAQDPEGEEVIRLALSIAYA
ncbi:hypothetical protein NPIL_650241 [Nephila pilipes]|uniref:Uncharacterized protein n=1 Tax=Nephila pilipes TaxID=299642 RepID=A0A8X6UJC5_NEPPI|nr:hypothetical protein NPIL_650241 [Nephila pilipes]